MTENATRSQATESSGEVHEYPFIRVVFQKGFPRDVGINGVRVQDVVQVAIEQLQQYQRGSLACIENDLAIQSLNEAIRILNERVSRRQEQGVLDTMSPHSYVRTEDELDDFSATGA